MKNAKLVAIEGLDGSGKQTQSNMLAYSLEASGYPTDLISFPNYEKDSSILVKKYLAGGYRDQLNKESNLTFVKQISSFYAVDRVSSFIEEDITEQSLIYKMQHGINMVCDRYTTSNVLHQTGNLKKVKDIIPYIKWIEDLEYVQLGLPKPDKVIYLDVLPQISIDNITKRYEGQPKEDYLENIEHLSMVYGRREIVIEECGWDVVNCCHDGKMKDKYEIHKEIIKLLQPIFPKLVPYTFNQ